MDDVGALSTRANPESRIQWTGTAQCLSSTPNEGRLLPLPVYGAGVCGSARRGCIVERSNSVYYSTALLLEQKQFSSLFPGN